MNKEAQSDSQIPAAFLEMLQTWRRELMVSIDQRIMEASQKTTPIAAPHVSALPAAAVPHAAVTYIPMSQLTHPGQGTQQLLYQY